MPQGFPDNASLKAYNQAVTDEFRSNDGKVGGRYERDNLLLLTTTGAKSGQPRVSPLVYLLVEGKLLVLGAYGGADINPAWVHNLRANPSARVEIGTESSDVTAHELAAAERDDLVPKIAAAAPAFTELQAKTARVIPVFELRPAISPASPSAP